MNSPFSIDTNLKTTPSPLSTAELIEALIQSQPATHRGLAGIGSAIIAASQKYQVNPTYILAHAIWETGWGTSRIYKEKNNLFGWTAYDSSPSESATSFASRADCINHVMSAINNAYLLPSGRYFVQSPCLGNKDYGMNVHYATDPNWGGGIASVARRLESTATDLLRSDHNR